MTGLSRREVLLGAGAVAVAVALPAAVAEPLVTGIDFGSAGGFTVVMLGDLMRYSGAVLGTVVRVETTIEDCELRQIVTVRIPYGEVDIDTSRPMPGFTFESRGGADLSK